MIQAMNRIHFGEEVAFCANFLRKKYEKGNFSVCEFAMADGAQVPLELSANRVYFTVVGNYQAPEIAQTLVEMSGEWQRKIFNGRTQYQFSIQYLYPTLPRTREEAIVFLNGIKGIGRKTAAAIIDQFGDINNALANADVMMASIKMMNTTRVERLRRAIDEVSAVKNMVALLSNVGINNMAISKIAQTYGASSMDMVTNRPYDMNELIGFQDCDAIALSQGTDPKNPERLKAAILFAMRTMRTQRIRIIQDGKEVIEIAQTMCAAYPGGAVEEADIRKQMKELLKGGENAELACNGQYLYLYEDFVAEKSLAMLIAELSRKSGTKADIARYWAAFDAWKRKNPQIQLAKNQELAVQAAANKLSVVTGGPGTGKTTVLKAIIETYQMAFPDSPVTLMAPTGLAAKRMEESCKMPAMTVHKAFGLVPDENSYAGFSSDDSCGIPGGLVICDEFSMVPLHLATFILEGIEDRDDTRIVFVGDIDQLPPIAPGAVLQALIQCGKVKVTRLTKNFRQEAGSSIVDLAYAVNEGRKNALKYENDVEMYDIDQPDGDEGERAKKILETIKDVFVKSCNEFGIENTFVISPTRRPSKEHPEYCLYSDKINEVLRDVVNPARPGSTIEHAGKEFRLHDRVISLKSTNDYINGDIGIITDLDANAKTITVQFDTKPVVFQEENLNQLELAYCITVHKSQGCEFKSVIMPCSATQKNMMTRHLLYTAVTRAKSRMTFVGDREMVARASWNVEKDNIQRDLLGPRIVKYC